MRKLKLFTYRWFRKLDTRTAMLLGLRFRENVYGDRINHLNCRSIWTDENNNIYYCKELVIVR